MAWDRIAREMNQMPTTFEIIADTNVHTGNWCGIMALNTGCTFAATGNAIDGTAITLTGLNGAINGCTIPANFTSIKLASGGLIAFLAPIA